MPVAVGDRRMRVARASRAAAAKSSASAAERPRARRRSSRPAAKRSAARTTEAPRTAAEAARRSATVKPSTTASVEPSATAVRTAASARECRSRRANQRHCGHKSQRNFREGRYFHVSSPNQTQRSPFSLAVCPAIIRQPAYANLSHTELDAAALPYCSAALYL